MTDANPVTKLGARSCAVDASVARVDAPCREHAEIEFVVPEFPASQPGQFLQVECGNPAPAEPHLHEWREGTHPTLRDREWGPPVAYLRRPFSIADRWNDSDGRVHMLILSRAVGPGTRWLEELKPGATVNISGPLGRGFELPKDRKQPVLLIGGGVGVPPLLYLARKLHEHGHPDVTLIFGAMTRTLVPLRMHAEPSTRGLPVACVQLPGSAPYPTIITTDDGTLGLRGRVTDALRAWKQQRGQSVRAQIYACGPERMLEAVAHDSRRFGDDAQLCIEKPMGCGLGTCLSCVVRVHDARRPAGWRWALSCTEGPCFPRDLLVEYDEPVESGARRE